MTDGARVPPGGSGQSATRQSDPVQSDDGRSGSSPADPRSSDSLPEDTLLGLPAAAELAGVHYMTVYRWVRTARLAAEKSGGIWKVRLGDLEALTGGGARGTSKADSAGRHRPARFDGSRVAPMTAALLRGDQGGAWLLVEESRRAGIAPVDVLCDLIEPAMAEIGRRWRNGEVSVADEHRATVVASRLIGRLGPAATRPGRSRGGIIVGAVEGNRHSLGSAVVADIFRAAGYDVTDLDLPERCGRRRGGSNETHDRRAAFGHRRPGFGRGNRGTRRRLGERRGCRRVVCRRPIRAGAGRPSERGSVRRRRRNAAALN